MQIFRGIEILGINNKYTMVDYLRRNNVAGDIMYTAAKNLDKKVKLSKEIGFDLEDNLNFDKNTICAYKVKQTENIITDIFNYGIPVEDENDFFSKYARHSFWKLIETLADVKNDEILFIIKVPVKEMNEMFGEMDGKKIISSQRIYGALNVQNGKANLVKNVVPQKETVENQVR